MVDERLNEPPSLAELIIDRAPAWPPLMMVFPTRIKYSFDGRFSARMTPMLRIRLIDAPKRRASTSKIVGWNFRLKRCFAGRSHAIFRACVIH